MFLDDLVPALRLSVNGPGGTLVAADDSDWVEALINAFWTARLRGYFKDYRVDGDQIVNINDPDVEMPREVAQVIVVYAAVTVIEAKILSLPTSTRAKAGPAETETQRAASVLVELLRQKRAELEQIRDETVATDPAVASFADLALVRLPHWVR